MKMNDVACHVVLMPVSNEPFRVHEEEVLALSNFCVVVGLCGFCYFCELVDSVLMKQVMNVVVVRIPHQKVIHVCGFLRIVAQHVVEMIYRLVQVLVLDRITHLRITPTMKVSASLTPSVPDVFYDFSEPLSHGSFPSRCVQYYDEPLYLCHWHPS